MKKGRWIAVLLVCVVIAACKRDKQPGAPVNVVPCAACYDAIVGYLRDTNGAYFYYPNAFTPNGDGKNDRLYMIYNGVDTAYGSITIWHASGRRVFAGGISQPWDGRDSTGAVCEPGKYPAQIKLRMLTGKIYEICACVNVLSYTGSCIVTHGNIYAFGDQVNPDSAYVYNTGESLCP